MFICFEGPDGSGKTTQVKRAAAYLRSLNREVLTLRDPGSNDPCGAALRTLLKSGTDGYMLGPEAELLGFLACRAHMVETAIKPALDAGQWVLCDRFELSTMVYQGFLRHRHLGDLQAKSGLGSGGLRPDHYLIFNAPVATLLSRLGQRPDGDRFDQDGVVRMVASAYQRPGCFIRDPYTIIDAAPCREVVTDSVQEVLREIGHLPPPLRYHEPFEDLTAAQHTESCSLFDAEIP